MLGKLSWSAIPWHEPLPFLSGGVVVIVILLVLALVLAMGWWP